MPFCQHERSVLQPDSFSFVNANAVTLDGDQCLYIVFTLVAYLVLFTVSQCEFVWSSLHSRKVEKKKKEVHFLTFVLIIWSLGYQQKRAVPAGSVPPAGSQWLNQSLFCFCYLNFICLCSKLCTKKGVQAFGTLVWCFILTTRSRSHVGLSRIALLHHIFTQ